MGFVADTKILTSLGWKRIADISGKDRVLVRNFLGEAEFTQPFALKKKQYDGEIINFGGAYWSVSVTPDHKVVFEEETVLASEITVDKHKHLHRRFRYNREDRPNEYLILHGPPERKIVLADEDWYTIVAYTVIKGYLSKDKNPRLKYMLDIDELVPLISVFDKYGISWSYGEVNGTIVITVLRDNNLARKLKLFLGARKRSEMRLPDKIVYGSSMALMLHFLRIIIILATKPAATSPNQLIMSTINNNLVDNLRMLCTFCGYGFTSTEQNGVHIIHLILSSAGYWSVRKIENVEYSGYVYEIDLFDGLVYVTEKNLAVWMSPK